MNITPLSTAELIERIKLLTEEIEILDQMREDVYNELDRRDSEV